MKRVACILLALLFICDPAGAATRAYWINGYKYYPLYKICQDKEIDYEWDAVGRTATLTKYDIEARLRVGSDKILVDGKELKDIGPPVHFYQGMVVVPSSFAAKGLKSIFNLCLFTNTLPIVAFSLFGSNIISICWSLNW